MSKKPRVLKLKPYLNLDAMRPRAADMARYALRLTRPFAGQADDPIELPDDEALAALEAWTLEADCPRWLRDRYRRHNKRRDTGGGGTRPTPNGLTDGEEAPKEEPVAGVQLSAKIVPLSILDREAVQRHGLPGWDGPGDKEGKQLSVLGAMAAYQGRQPNALCLKELLSAFGVTPMPKTQFLRMQALVLYVLRKDLLPFEKKGAGIMKEGLPVKVLRAAAEIWRRTHPPPQTPPKALKDVDPKAPYAELWNGLKRPTPS